MYNGTWNNGYPEGNGKLTFKNGVSIDGTWSQGKLEKINSGIAPRNEPDQKKSLGLSLPLVEKTAGTKSCAKNSSYTQQCSDTHKYENGSVYAGSWFRGYPHGNGKITFANGGSIDGFWQAGTLQRVKKETAANGKALKKSVTFFSGVSGKKINSLFREVTAGHTFASGSAERWMSAYCYVYLKDQGELIQISLSRYSSFNSRLLKEKYSFDERYSSSDFTKAQNACPYQWNDFN